MLAVALLGLALAPSSGWSVFPLDGFVPENGAGVHDPSVCAFDGHYLCLHTGDGLGLMRTSTDLVHWQTVGPAIRETPDWLRKAIPQHRSVWAPEAIRVGDGLRMYYCASAAFGRNDSWIAYADCPHFDPAHPTEGWIDRGPIVQSQAGRDDFNAIDPSILTDAQGRQWMFFGSYWSGIYVTEMDPATGKPKDPEHRDMKCVAKNLADRANGIEASSAVYRDGYYYLLANYGLAAQGVRSTYRIVVGRSRAPDGPFLDARGKPMTEGGHETLLDSSPPMFGPGGGGMFRDAKGRWLLSYHYYDGRRAWGRQWGLPTLQIREVLWSSDGWPMPGLPVCPDAEALARHPTSPSGRWLVQRDFGDVETVELRKDGRIERDGRPGGSWKRDGDRLELDSEAVQLAYGGHYFVGRTASGGVIRGFKG